MVVPTTERMVGLYKKKLGLWCSSCQMSVSVPAIIWPVGTINLLHLMNVTCNVLVFVPRKNSFSRDQGKMLHIHVHNNLRSGNLEKIASGLAHFVCYFRALFKILKFITNIMAD